MLAMALGFITPSTTDLPRLPAPPFQRAVPITPVDRDGCTCRLLPHPLGPSPNSSRVGIHKFPFEACSGFTRVTARWIAQPPDGDLCHEASLRPVAQPNRSSATRSTDNSLGGTSLHWCYAPSGRTAVEKGILRESPRNIDSRSKTNKQFRFKKKLPGFFRFKSSFYRSFAGTFSTVSALLR